MIGTSETYFIRPDYTPRQEAETVEVESGDYWTEHRKKTARIYQHYVYALAAQLTAQRPEGKRSVADVGCGYPYKAATIVGPHAEHVAAFDQPTLKHIVAEDFPSIAFRPINLESPPPVSETYDVVICADVLEHLLAPDVCMAFLRSITKPTGALILSTPERDILRGPDCLTSEKPEHVREWNKAEFAAFVSHSGLRIVRHFLMPEAELPDVNTLAFYLAAGRAKTRKWSGCQTAVCTVDGWGQSNRPRWSM